MDITAKTTFRHGRKLFQESLSYSVPDPIGQYFVKQGWAEAAAAGTKCYIVEAHELGADADPAKREAESLEIQNLNLTLKGEVQDGEAR